MHPYRRKYSLRWHPDEQDQSGHFEDKRHDHFAESGVPSDTLRGYLDSFGQHGGAALNDVHRGVGLFSIQIEDDEGRITLEATISSEGGSLLISQRHIWHLPGPSPVAVSF